jgi:phage shock protein A
MPSLLDKLNTLVKSSVNSFLDDIPGSKTSVHPARLGKDIDQEVAALRKRIEEALSEEDAMKQRLDVMQQEIDRADKQADIALQQGDESTARALVQQIQRQQQQAAMLQTDLEQHRRSTSDFIERVNTLDAIVSDARSQKGQPAEPATNQETKAPGAVLSNMLRDARERVENAISPQSEEEVHHIKINVGDPAPTPSPDPAKVDADLAERRTRLSKPD